MKIAIGVGFALICAASAFGQDTGGMRALDVAPTAQANMLGTPATRFFLVDGQNDGLNLGGNRFVTWDEGVALGLEQTKALQTEESLGEVARKYREVKASTKAKSVL